MVSLPRWWAAWMCNKSWTWESELVRQNGHSILLNLLGTVFSHWSIGALGGVDYNFGILEKLFLLGGWSWRRAVERNAILAGLSLVSFRLVVSWCKCTTTHTQQWKLNRPQGIRQRYTSTHHTTTHIITFTNAIWNF